MADVRCSRCGEPWDVDTFHDEADASGESFAEVRARFRASGCVAVGGGRCESTPAGTVAGVLADLLGDDVDGLAATLEDAEALGLL